MLDVSRHSLLNLGIQMAILDGILRHIQARFEWTNSGHRILLLLDECDHLVQQQQFQDCNQEGQKGSRNAEVTKEKVSNT